MSKSKKTPGANEFMDDRKKTIMELALKRRQQKATEVGLSMEEKSKLMPQFNVPSAPPPPQS